MGNKNHKKIDWEHVYALGVKRWKACHYGDPRSMAKFNLLNRPQLGDLVFETTVGPKEGPASMGFLISTDYNNGWLQYWILGVFNGVVLRWENSKFAQIEGWHLSDFDELRKIAKMNEAAT